MSVDYRLAPAHPYPAQGADQHLAIRWLKAHAADFGGDASILGAVGSSSGGHTVLLCAMRPHDRRYAALPLVEAPAVDATLSYVIALWPVVDPHARYVYTKADPAAGGGPGGPERLQERTLGFFLTEEGMQEASPQVILDRGERVSMPPLLILHPDLDRNVPRPLIERFVLSYRKAGGEVEVEWFANSGHGFIRTPGPETDRAVASLKRHIVGRLEVGARTSRSIS